MLRATTARAFSKLHISASKSGPIPWCFAHFDFEMCFAPQRRALFRNWTSEPPKVVRTPGAFNMLTSNVLRATRACTFTTSQLPKVVQTPCVFTFWLRNVLRATTACNFSSLIWPAGSAPAALASLLFDPQEPQIIGKTVFCDFPTFSRICIFFLLTLSLLLFFLLIFLFSLPLPCSAFHLSIFSKVWLLNFLRSLLHPDAGVETTVSPGPSRQKLGVFGWYHTMLLYILGDFWWFWIITQNIILGFLGIPK